MFRRKRTYDWVLDELCSEIVVGKVVLAKFKCPKLERYELEARRALRQVAKGTPELRWAREWVADHTYAVEVRLLK